ncbi:hypothetical protein GCM10017771_50400 [Streptomyces capitiformicae]|uniref:Uncharacterized protein n=1 Tax=Streptomyces capitiformicae TaxID=2014920 RepID=A0A919DAX6_9ACTN|nr:hypothetical protein GCM10017771_50400 [Streptomyces capitiformicae]
MPDARDDAAEQNEGVIAGLAPSEGAFVRAAQAGSPAKSTSSIAPAEASEVKSRSTQPPGAAAHLAKCRARAEP